MDKTISRFEGEIYANRLQGFTLPGRNARGRAVRLDQPLEEILAAHAYPAPIKHLLAEALVLAALLGSLIKGENSQLTMQAQTEQGVVRLLVVDFRGGELRGYVDFDQDELEELGANPSLTTLFGKGYLAITFDVGSEANRYQGIVPLEGESLSEACESYFAQSEQVPTLVRVAVASSEAGCSAAGLLAQHLPDGEEGRERLHARMDHPEWEHVAILASSVRHEELLDTQLSMDALIWRLFHEEEEVRIQPGADIRKGCRCSVEHYRSVLEQFPEEERVAMRDETGAIQVDCAFCSKIFPIIL